MVNLETDRKGHWVDAVQIVTWICIPAARIMMSIYSEHDGSWLAADSESNLSFELSQVQARHSFSPNASVVFQEKFSGVDIRVRVSGGGHVAQIYAIRQAISKALVAYYQKCKCN